MPINNDRLPGLDGIRAIAILMVIALHLCQRYAVPKTGSPGGTLAFLLLGLGGDSVGIFFVLSGFLITTLLLREQEKTGHISLRDFYIRRAFRILPPLYSYLLFIVIFCIATGYPLHIATITGSLFFYLNYFPGDGQWLTQHTWSLCVEEQFYLLWPIALLWFFKRGGRIAAAKFAAFLIAITPFLRIAGKLSNIAIFQHHFGIQLHTRMDSLMCGCLVALLSNTSKFEKLYAHVETVWWLLPLEFFVFSGIGSLYLGAYYRNSFGYTIDSIFMALFVVWSTRNAGTLVGRFLNSWLMKKIGILSYSVYIWQTFFIHPANPTRLNHMPWAIAFICVTALFSYNFIEQPSLRLRKLVEYRIKNGSFLFQRYRQSV